MTELLLAARDLTKRYGASIVVVPCLLFLSSGSICMTTMNAASFEALYSAFSRKRLAA